MLDTFDLILEELVDFSQTELIPADKSIFVVEKNSVQEVESSCLAIEVADAIVVGFVVVDFDYFAVGKVESLLQVDNLFGLYHVVDLFKDLKVADLEGFVLSDH